MPLLLHKKPTDDYSIVGNMRQDRWWGDGTSRNDVSPYECPGTPGPQINRLLRHNVPEMIHPSYEYYALYNRFRLVQNDRDVSIQGHCVSGTIHLGDHGSQKIRTGTHRLGTSRHPTGQGCVVVTICSLWLSKVIDQALASFAKALLRKYFTTCTFLQFLGLSLNQFLARQSRAYESGFS